MLKVRCTRRTTSASASASATTRSPFTRCTTLPLWGLLLTAPAKRAHENYFNCMHLKARQQKTREAEGVRESGTGWERERWEGEGKKEAKRAFQEDVERQSKHRPEASAALRAGSSSKWVGGRGVRHSYATVVAHRSSTRPFE